MNTAYDEIRAVLHGIWQKRWLSLGVAWVVCILGWISVAMVPNTFESHARVFVQLDDPLSQQVGIGAGQRRSGVEAIRNTLTSTAHMEQLVRATPLGAHVTGKRQMEGLVAGLAKSIKITADDDNMFEIAATSSSMRFTDSENARLAQTIVAKLIDIFRNENNLVNRGQLRQTVEFLDQQLAERGAQLQAADQRRIAFEAKFPEAAEGGASLVQRLEQARSELRSIDGDIAAAQGGIASLTAQLASISPTIAGGAGGSARSALGQALTELSQMRARGLTDNHPDMIALRNQIAGLKAQAQAEGAGGGAAGIPNPAYAALQSVRAERAANLQALQVRRATIEADLARVAADQAQNPEVATQAQAISRDYDVLKQQYDKLLADREALKLRSSVEDGPNPAKVQIIDPPIAARRPIAPNRPLLLLAVLVAGIGAGLGVAYAAREVGSTFDTTSRLENATGLPVLGAISKSLSEAALAEGRRRLRYFIVATAALGGLFVVLLMVESFQRSMVA